MLGFQVVVKPLPVAVRLRPVARIVAARISAVVLVVDGSLARATLWLQPIPVAGVAVKFARVFNDFAAAAQFQQTGHRHGPDFRRHSSAFL